MIVERRSYLLKPRAAREFWAVQRDWYWPPEIGDFFNHLIGYFETTGFETTGAGGKSIVHLYRFESLAEWESTYRALYRRFPPDYFTVVRKLLAAQENTFMAPAPVDLPTIAEVAEPLGPPIGYGLYDQPPPPGLIVQECITDFHPGGVFVHWDALRTAARSSGLIRHNLIGMFQSTVGRLHRIYEYRWFASAQEARSFRAELENDADAICVDAKSEACRMKRTLSILRPAPFGWLRPLFEKMAWDRFEERDPQLRRIGPWPPPVE